MPRDLEILNHWKPEPPTRQEEAYAREIDLTDYEIYSRKLELVCFEGHDIMMKLGVSPMIQAGDVAVGIYTPQGDLAVGAMGTQLHLVNAAFAIKYADRYFKDDPTVGIKPGDMFYVNDVLYGGLHNPDQILFCPIFYNGELIAWSSAASMETETGATEPGGNPPSAKSRYDEGMRLAPFKVGENYQLRFDLVDLMENFVRDPRQQTLDLKSRAAVCYIVEKRILDVVEKKGRNFLAGIMRRMIDETAEAARRRIASLNDGIYRAPVFIDNIGSNKFGIVKGMVNLHKNGDTVLVDFSGTSPRVPQGNFNSFNHCMIAMTACYLYQFLFCDLKPSGGVFVPLEFKFPAGCYLDADPDDAVSLGVSTIAHTSTALHAAFEKMLFDSENHDYVISPWPSSSSTVALAGITPGGLPYSAWDQGIPNGVGMGAKHDGDGTDCGGFIWNAIGEFIDAEQFESQYPFVTLFRNRFFRDGHGFGKYRGGRAISVGFLVHNTPAAYAVSISGYGKMPIGKGLYGGYAPAPQAVIYCHQPNLAQLIAEGKKVPRNLNELLDTVQGQYVIKHPNSDLEILMQGDIAVATAIGGPGYGDCLERDPDLVMQDLREESISPWVAQNVYHLVYNPETMVVDYEATAKARQEEREKRKQRGLPYDAFMREWSHKKPREDLLAWYGPWPVNQPA